MNTDAAVATVIGKQLTLRQGDGCVFGGTENIAYRSQVEHRDGDGCGGLIKFSVFHRVGKGRRSILRIAWGEIDISAVKCGITVGTGSHANDGQRRTPVITQQLDGAKDSKGSFKYRKSIWNRYRLNINRDGCSGFIVVSVAHRIGKTIKPTESFCGCVGNAGGTQDDRAVGGLRNRGDVERNIAFVISDQISFLQLNRRDQRGGCGIMAGGDAIHSHRDCGGGLVTVGIPNRIGKGGAAFKTRCWGKGDVLTIQHD